MAKNVSDASAQSSEGEIGLKNAANQSSHATKERVGCTNDLNGGIGNLPDVTRNLLSGTGELS